MLNDYEKSVLMSTAEAMLANRCGMFERFKQDVEMRRHDWFFNALDIAEFKMVFMRNKTLVLHAHPQTADDEAIEAAAKVVAKWARNQPAPYVPKPLPPVVPASPAPVVADSASNAPAPTPVEPAFTIMKKKALIAQLEHEWPSIRADMSDAGRNDLKDAAATGVHGEWFVEPARAWAQRKGKLKQAAPANPLGAWHGPITRNQI